MIYATLLTPDGWFTLPGQSHVDVSSYGGMTPDGLPIIDGAPVPDALGPFATMTAAILAGESL